MPNETILDDLVSRYHELRRQGQTPSPEAFCADHPELVNELQARLKAHASMEAFLGAGEGDAPKQLLSGQREPQLDGQPAPPDGPLADPYATRKPQESDEAPAAPVAGRSWPAVEGYEIQGKLGHGGMGVVYRAHDVRLNREVAIKSLRDDDPADPGAASRFRTEAQITGQLQHPGIPAVHELGTLPDDRPFLAMKLVKGQTLSALLRERADPSQRRGHFLAIFEQICQAIGYAHAHQVIHRDLKPGNVMVGAFGEVQVIDWGLAKVLPASWEHERPEADPEAELPETMPPVTAIETPRGGGSGTRTGQVMGTPAYMAPEQAGGEVRRLDARSDVFGLGAILCQILTGQPPYQGNDGNDVRLKAVRGELGDALARLDTCGAEPDLVALGKRCLAFRQEDRPADGGAVAAAVAGIRAAAEERARRAEQERAEALVREAEQRKRRRVWLGLAASLLVGLIASTALALWANHSRQQAHQAATAEREAKETALEREAETKAALDFVEKRVFAAARPRGQGGLGPEVSLRQALQAALRFVAEGFADQPLIEARLRMTLGISFGLLSELETSRQQFQRAFDLCKATRGPDHPDTLTCMHNLGNCYDALGRHTDALMLYEKTLSLRKAKLGLDHPETLTTMNNLATCYHDLGRLADALKLHKETLALRKAKLSPDHPDTLTCMHNLGNCYDALGRHADALKFHEEALTLRKAKLGPEHPDTLMTMSNLANCYAALGRHRDALKVNEETLALRKARLGPEHIDTLASMHNLANSYYYLGRHADALKLYEETLRLRRTNLGLDHPHTLQSMHGLACSNQGLGRHADAMKLFEEALELRKAKLGPDHPETLTSMHSLAASYYALGRHADALKLSEETLALQKAKLGPEHPHTLRSMMGLASSYFALGRHGDALKLYEETLAFMEAQLGPEHPDTLMTMSNLAHSYAALGRHADALRLHEETLALQKAKLGAEHPHALVSMNNLANSYRALGRHADALKLHEETTTLRKAKLGPNHLDTLVSMGNLANSYAALGRHADALRLREETLAPIKAVLGPDHPDTLRSMRNLASGYITLRRSEEAAKLLQDVFDRLQKQAAQPDNAQAQMSVALTQGQLGLTEEVRQQFAAAAQTFSQALERFDQLDQAGKLKDAYFRGQQHNFRLRLAICGKAEQAVADLDFALRQPTAEVPELLDARLRVLLHKKDRAGVVATAAAWQQLAEKDAGQCYAAAAAWSLASQLAADEKERGHDAAKTLALLQRALEAKKPSPTPLLLAWRLEQDPDFAPLRSQPAFAAFVKELHAAGETQGAAPP